jgi:hypothetical protein
MNEQQLRALVREALVQYTSAGRSGGSTVPAAAVFRHHASHQLFVLPTGEDGDGPCLIEPAVPCTHCGYCTSYGH